MNDDGAKILTAIEAQIAKTSGETQEHWRAAKLSASKAIGVQVRRGRPPLDATEARKLLDSGKSPKEVAEAMGCSVDWVHRLRRAARST